MSVTCTDCHRFTQYQKQSTDTCSPVTVSKINRLTCIFSDPLHCSPLAGISQTSSTVMIHHQASSLSSHLSVLQSQLKQQMSLVEEKVIYMPTHSCKSVSNSADCKKKKKKNSLIIHLPLLPRFPPLAADYATCSCFVQSPQRCSLSVVKVLGGGLGEVGELRVDELHVVSRDQTFLAIQLSFQPTWLTRLPHIVDHLVGLKRQL